MKRLLGFLQKLCSSTNPHPSGGGKSQRVMDSRLRGNDGSDVSGSLPGIQLTRSQCLAGNADLSHQVALSQSEPTCHSFPASPLGMHIFPIKQLRANRKHSYAFLARTPGTRKKRLWASFIVAIFGLSTSAYGAVDNVNVSANTIEIPDGVNTLTYSFDVSFKPVQKNLSDIPNYGKFAEYRVTLSDTALSSPTDLPVVTNLQQYLMSGQPIVFNQGMSTPTEMQFQLGNYSGVTNPDTSRVATDITGRVTVKLNAQALRTAKQADSSFRLNFEAAIHDVTSTQTLPNIVGSSAATIAISLVPSVRISQLRDMALNENTALSPDGQFYQQTQSFCVYASQNPHLYLLEQVNTANNGNTTFALGGPGGTLPYEMAFNGHGGALSDYKSIPAQLELQQVYVGSPDPNCADGKMSQLGIRIRKTDADSMSDGAYSDTVTLTVKAL